MTRSLAAAWALERIVRSLPLASCAMLILAALCVVLESERRALQHETQTLAHAAAVVPSTAMSESDTALDAWRQQLSREAARLPPRKNVAAIVRAATGILEASGVAIDSINTSQAAHAATPYAALTLEARLSGSAVRAAAALSDILADSPGWSLERLSIERQSEGMASIEALLVLVHGGAL